MQAIICCEERDGKPWFVAHHGLFADCKADGASVKEALQWLAYAEFAEMLATGGKPRLWGG